MTIQINNKIPSVKIKIVSHNEVSEVNTTELFGSGKSVLFGVPGAFTPTCSQSHLPGYVVNADNIKAKGVDRIVCMSVNDAFVMKAWGEASNAEQLIMLADGNGDLTEALGLTLDASAAGMGKRCQRFAMIIESGVIIDLFIEEPKKFEVSNAESLMTKL
ncbi:peroxiredoxin [Aliikangiella sp. IMCC44359]|uniref:peroxiredoxin n=1 Tax=Aliikangiella sp. IMCC44359 TaxID=3459125 RepID=UPI00403AC0D4